MRKQPGDEAALLTAYEVLASRYASTTAFQWQVPAFVLAGQAGVIVAIISVGNMAGAVLLGVGSLLAAAAAAVVIRRVELTAWWDRAMLDAYEEKLLPREFRLHHARNLDGRLRHRPFRLSGSARRQHYELRMVRYGSPSLVLVAMMFATGIVSLITAALR